MKSHIVLASILLLGFISPSFAQNGTTLEAIKAAAEAGNPAAQDHLAEQYVLRLDMNQAEAWYRKAAAQGYAHAQGKLAEMLLNRARMSFSMNPEIKLALGDEGVKWAVLAANQADELGQAKLAETYAEGKFIKQDWIQVYKWGELAARNPGSMFNPAGILAGSLRNSAILNLSDDQLAEAKNLVAEFSPHQTTKDELPVPAWVKQIKLSGLSGPANNRLAIINNETFLVGEDYDLKLTGKTANVKCVEIRENSVLVKIQGIDHLCELTMSE